MKKIFITAGLLAAACIQTSFSQTRNFVVNAGQPGAAIQPTMWGVFFEDINLGADGGIYAELVKNRSFEFAKPMMGWTALGKRKEGELQVINRQNENKANPRFLRVKVDNRTKGELGIVNEGFRGMGLKQGLRYDFSVLYRQNSSGIKLHLELINAKEEVIGSGSVDLPHSTAWKKQTASFKSTATEAKAKLRIWFEGNGEVDMDMISLFPSDTWKNRPGGLRADMVQLLADMKPGFIRFPGGCIVEGIDLSNRFQWKKTVGPVEERQLIMNRWNVEFPARSTPDYFQTFGLGFFEYFQLAEDLGAEPLPILNCGMACQYNTAELAAIDELGPYIQDALDLVEFANGDISTKWGKLRADMGHPKSFNLKMMGVGNENWGPQYIERVKIFTKAIKEKYPEIDLVFSSGTGPDGERFEYLNTELRKMNADIIDEHYYKDPDWFLRNAARYDSYPRNGSKVFAGEYAAHPDRNIPADKKNNLNTAISEAAFLTGLERNADVVHMASYAPLFAHIEGWQWAPDLIWVDNLRSYGTPNYHVQKLYATNKGTNVLPITLDDKVATGQDGLYASSVIDYNKKEIIIKVVNTSEKEVKGDFLIHGTVKPKSKGSITVLTGENPLNANSLEKPDEISPKVSAISVRKNKVSASLAPNSFSLIKLTLE